jgi:hypothetical protein
MVSRVWLLQEQLQETFCYSKNLVTIPLVLIDLSIFISFFFLVELGFELMLAK